MVIELADRARWCVLDSIKAAQNSALGFRCTHYCAYCALCHLVRVSAA